MKSSIRTMLEKALAWEQGKVKADGDIDIEGSTRVGLEKNRMGMQKTTGYGEIVRAFAFGSNILERPDFQRTAELIARFRWKVK